MSLCNCLCECAVSLSDTEMLVEQLDLVYLNIILARQFILYYNGICVDVYSMIGTQ